MKDILKKLSLLFLFVLVVILLMEAFFNPIDLFLDGRFLLVILLGLFIVLRLVKINIVSKILFKINLYVLLLLTITSYLLLFAENTYGFQYVMTRFGIDYSRFIYLTLTSVAIALYAVSFNLSEFIFKKAIFVFPIYLGLIAFFVYVRNNVFFRTIIQDDHLVEYLQFFLFLTSSYLCFYLAKYWQRKEKILATLFLLGAVACFFVAGEEISWGQRLFNLTTPELISEKNLQDELTLHNVDSVFGLVYRGYMIIGLFGSIGWLLFKLIKNKLSNRLRIILSNIIPNRFLFFYFFQAFVYNLDRLYLRPATGESLWEEPMELLLIFGVTLFFAVKYFRVCGSKITKNINKF